MVFTHQVCRVNGGVVAEESIEAVIRRLQDQSFAVSYRGQLRRNARTQRSSINDNAVFGITGSCHPVDQQSIIVQHLFISFACTFTITGIIHHPYFIIVFGKIGSKGSVAFNISPVAMKIENNAFANRVWNGEADNINGLFVGYSKINFFERDGKVEHMVGWKLFRMEYYFFLEKIGDQANTNINKCNDPGPFPKSLQPFSLHGAKINAETVSEAARAASSKWSGHYSGLTI